jgi:hypothetical protein
MGLFFQKQSVTMTQSEAEEDGCDGESGDEEQSEEGDDEVEVVKGSGESSVRSAQLIRRWGLLRESVPGSSHW